MADGTSTQELIELVRRGTGNVEKPTLEAQLDAICDSLTGLVLEHQRLSVEADRSRNRYKKRYAERWAYYRAHKHDEGAPATAKDIEQSVILDTLQEELIADMDDTLAKTQGELVDAWKMVLAGKRSLLQSVLAEYHNTNGTGGTNGNGTENANGMDR